MLVIGGGILGVLVGGFTARKRGGSTADILQYAAGFGIAFALLGMILTLILTRLAM